ncbi:hypothetical protein NN561_019617 [Cricetulus griseus]
MGIAWRDSGREERSAECRAREESQRLSEGPRWRHSLEERRGAKDAGDGVTAGWEGREGTGGWGCPLSAVALRAGEVPGAGAAADKRPRLVQKPPPHAPFSFQKQKRVQAALDGAAGKDSRRQSAVNFNFVGASDTLEKLWKHWSHTS